jgi:lipid A 3-O-deacylase
MGHVPAGAWRARVRDRRTIYVVGAALSSLLASLGAPGVAGAQTIEVRAVRQLTIENDLLALRGAGAPPDFDYTHGTRLTVATARVPAWARPFLGRPRACDTDDSRRVGCVSAAMSLGQEIFTPRRDSVVPIAGERPYAGWLYASATAQAVTATRTRSIGVAIGVTGPPSGAEGVQRAMHRWLGNRTQLGWAHQVPGRAVLNLELDEQHATSFTVARHVLVIGTAGGGLTVGSLRRALRAEGTLEIGRSGARTLWRPGDGAAARPLGWYLRAGVRPHLVGHDGLLSDGAGGASPALLRFVGQGEGCVGYRGVRGALQYCHTWRGREYRAQPGAHAFGGLVVRLHAPSLGHSR